MSKYVINVLHEETGEQLMTIGPFNDHEIALKFIDRYDMLLSDRELVVEGPILIVDPKDGEAAIKEQEV